MIDIRENDQLAPRLETRKRCGRVRERRPVPHASRQRFSILLIPRRAERSRDALHHIRVPLLVLQGLADPYGTAAQAETARDQCPAPVDMRLMAAVGHAPWREAEAEVLEAVLAFAARLGLVAETNG